MLNIAVLGAGRMGQQVLRLIDATEDALVCGVWSRTPGPVGDHAAVSDLEAVLATADVAIDFSLPAATDAILAGIGNSATPLICGVSGLGVGQLSAMEHAAADVPILHDRNMSYGIAVLNRLLRAASAAFDDDYECVVHETHHVHKLDAPSGTALLLGETIADARGRSLDELRFYEPERPQARPPAGSIRFVVRRQGEVPGDHRVDFVSAAETVSLSHSVADRRVFAEGAVRAAHWIVGQPPGLYRMADVLLS